MNPRVPCFPYLSLTTLPQQAGSCTWGLLRENTTCIPAVLATCWELFLYMDAFALLREGASKKKKHAPSKTSGKRARSSSSPLTPSPASQGSRFVECPLCGKSVHSSLAQAHVGRCTPAEGEISPAGLDASLVAASSVTSARQEEAGGTSSGKRSAETPPSPPLPAPPAQAPPSVEKPTSTATASPTTPTVRSVRKTPTQAQAPANAFSTLMAASALSNFREEMYLWAHEDGAFSWGWGPVGNPLPPPPSTNTTSSGTTATTNATGVGGNRAPSGHRSWSCQVATKGPDGRKAGMCDLWTNLAPPATNPAGGGENAVSLEAGGGGGSERSRREAGLFLFLVHTQFTA